MPRLIATEKHYDYHTMQEYEEHRRKMELNYWICVEHYDLQTLSVKSNVKKSDIYVHSAKYQKGLLVNGH